MIFKSINLAVISKYRWQQEHYDYYREIYPQYLTSIKFEYTGRGASREAYKRGNIVVKVPLHEYGIMDNFIEAKAYSKYRNAETTGGWYDLSKKKISLAPCHLMNNHCLMMPFIEKEIMKLPPDWVLRLDGGQAGLYNGRYVAYDYGHDAYVERQEVYKEFTNLNYV